MLVYKYRSGSDRDISSLKDNQLYSASLEKLNDIQEAKIIINHKEFELIDIYFKSKAPDLGDTINEIIFAYIKRIKEFGIYSLSRNYNNELLWAYYANSQKGFCIEYDLEKLKQHELQGEFFCNVDYQSQIPIINFEDTTEPKESILTTKVLATKSKNWEHEDEYRMITGEVGIKHFYNSSVKSIYFGSRAETETIKKVMDALKGRKIKYYQMSHKEDLYELERNEIEDIHKDYSIYENKENLFKPQLDEKISPYEDLIKKAIIIVEQEPMCSNVSYAYISSFKGTLENPIFYVLYDDKIRNISSQKYEISKEEIETIFTP